VKQLSSKDQEIKQLKEELSSSKLETDRLVQSKKQKMKQKMEILQHQLES